MKLHPLSIALAEAPARPFEPDGPQVYKVVVRSRAHGVFSLTREHPSAQAALDDFAGIAGRVQLALSTAGAVIAGDETMRERVEKLERKRRWR